MGVELALILHCTNRQYSVHTHNIKHQNCSEMEGLVGEGGLGGTEFFPIYPGKDGVGVVLGQRVGIKLKIVHDNMRSSLIVSIDKILYYIRCLLGK